MSYDATGQLTSAGVSIWLDDLSRRALADGSLAKLIAASHVSGVTTNPTIFHAAIASGHHYDAALRRLKLDGADAAEAVFRLTTADVSDACDLFSEVFRRTGGVDGRVSIEVDPELARDAEATYAQALALHAAVDRPNVLIKIPATVEGLVAIEECLAAGISVNVTLIFSLERYRAVIAAYQAGVRRARLAGHDVAALHSVASFFVSRVDAEIDARLDALGGDDARALKGRAGTANARLAYDLCEREFSTDDWAELASAGARRQRPLWASTGVNDPSLPDTMYVTELVAPGVVNTMPRATLDAVQDHGVVRGDTITGYRDRARRVLDLVAEAGVDYDDVVRVLEEDGLRRFASSWSDLLDDVAGRLRG